MPAVCDFTKEPSTLALKDVAEAPKVPSAVMLAKPFNISASFAPLAAAVVPAAVN